MYCVFWLFDGVAMNQEFVELTDALKKCEALRKEGVARFVTMAVENPNMVGKMGVDVTGPDYDWTKRRDSISARRKGYRDQSMAED